MATATAEAKPPPRSSDASRVAALTESPRPEIAYSEATLAAIANYPKGKKVGVSGEIAAGKSVLCANLKSVFQQHLPDWKVFFSQESVPVARLNQCINDPKRWSDHFQTVMFDRAVSRQAVCNYAAPDAFIMERPPEENVVFAVANSRPEIGNMSAEYFHEWYKHAYYEHVNEAGEMDLLVYLFAPDTVLNQRRKERDRIGEDHYESLYMTVLGDTFFRWAIERASKRKLLVLDWTKYGDPVLVLAEISKYLNNPELLPSITLIDATTLCTSGEVARHETPAPKPYESTILDLVEVAPKSVLLSRSTDHCAPQHIYIDTSDVKKRRQLQYLILSELAAGKSTLTVAL